MKRIFRGFLKILQAEFILYVVLGGLGGIVYLILGIL